MSRCVILIGFMGAGKSTIGRKLSSYTDLPLIDTDREIEKRAGMHISDIFASKGEAAFRRMETEELNMLIGEETPAVISCGGGMPLSEENRALLHRLGRVYFLSVSPETVIRRLHGDKTRPLLQGPDASGKVRKLMEERKEAYTLAADRIIDVDSLSLRDITSLILEDYQRECLSL